MNRLSLLSIFFILAAGLCHSAEVDYSKEIREAMSLKSQMTRLGYEYSIDDLSIYEQEEYLASKPNEYQREGKTYFIPFDLDRGDLIKTSIVAGAAIVLFNSDEEIKDFAEEHKTEQTQVYADIGERFGAGVEAMALATGGYVVGVVLKNEKVRSVSLLAINSMLMSGLVTRALKTSLRRVRPRSTDDSNEWFETLRDHSFPSGHTTLAFSIGTFIAESTKHKSKVIPILAYGVSALAGAARVHDSAHWASDVVIGALIGHLVTKNIMNKKPKKSGFAITPYLNHQGDFMVGLNYRHKEPTKKSDCNKQPQAFKACLLEAMEQN